MSRIVAVHTPAWREGEARVHLLKSQRREGTWWRTRCGKDTTEPVVRGSTWRRCRVENARGTWCRTCLHVAGIPA